MERRRRNFILGARPTRVTIPTTGRGTLSVATHDDAVVEADGAVTATVIDGTGYLAASASPARAVVEDNEPDVHITASPTTVSAGGAITFTLTASPAPNTARTVRVSVGDSLLSGTPPPTVDIPAAVGDAEESEATFSVTTADDAMGTVTATVQARLQAGYRVGSPSSANVTVTRDPVVTITADQGSVTEGATMEFVVTASPAPPTGTTLRVEVELGGVVSFLSDTTNRTAPLTRDEPSETLSVTTVDNSAVDGHGDVTATILDGTGYRVGDPEQADVFVWDNESGNRAGLWNVLRPQDSREGRRHQHRSRAFDRGAVVARPDDGRLSHPGAEPSVMSDPPKERNCSPQPLDMFAIYALYQTFE